MTKYESEVKLISRPQETVYERFSDLRNLEGLHEKLQNDESIKATIANAVGEERAAQAVGVLEKMTIEPDALTLNTPIGNIRLGIIEKEAPKLIKFAAEGSPVPVNVWLQLVPADAESCKLRVTVGAEVNMFLRGMVAKPLQQAADGLATILQQAANHLA